MPSQLQFMQLYRSFLGNQPGTESRHTNYLLGAEMPAQEGHTQRGVRAY